MAEMVNQEAIELNEIEQPEIDQPGDSDSLSLDEVLGSGETADDQTGEQPTGAETQAGDADPQPKQTKQGRTYTQEEFQAEFDKAFSARANGLRNQFAREHREELELAAMVKRTFPGMKPEEIDDKLLTEEARSIAASTGWTEQEAKDKIKARRAYERTGRTQEESDPYLDMLQSQVDTIMARDGVDMVKVLNDDQSLAKKVDAGEMDIKDAYAHYLKSGGAKPSAKPATKPPVVQKRAGAASTPSGRVLSDADIDRIDEQLRRGQKVRME